MFGSPIWQGWLRGDGQAAHFAQLLRPTAAALLYQIGGHGVLANERIFLLRIILSRKPQNYPYRPLAFFFFQC